ncbi:MAG TPA: hypothetical protein VLV83_11190 [Acidobacteriota bacterium]|nr:hypothetical protein [Acidobacteriota bacterium]
MKKETPRMPWLGWAVVAIALLLGGWLAFDGLRALIIGDYVTPSSGRFAGQLGPWSKLVEAVGIDPRSTLMKAIHVIVGAAWIEVAATYIFKLRGSRTALLLCAAATLWYLPFGTLLSLVVIALLFAPALRTWPA